MDIAQSVGSGGTNAKCDVFCVQLLLNVWRASKELREIREDGIVGPETIAAIEKFQHDVTKWVDGRVDPGGRAHRALREFAAPYVNEALGFISLGIPTTVIPLEYENLVLPTSELNIVRIDRLRQNRDISG